MILPKIATHLDAEAALPIGCRTLVFAFITADVTTVLSQLAGTALTITFGKLVRVGQIVSLHLNNYHMQVVLISFERI
jgi:hypothetical protein